MTFRPGTDIPPVKIAFMYNMGGLGDYIHFTNAIKYAIDQNPHIYGYIKAPPFFIELARHWFKSYDRFQVVEEIPPESVGSIAVGPNRYQIVGSSTFHLLQLGFIMYNKLAHVPEGYQQLQRIYGNEVSIDHFNLPEKYVVLPIMATAMNRSMPSYVTEEIIKYLKSWDITPVILGKRKLMPDYTATDYYSTNLEGCIDLREKTGLLEAACIMSKAQAVVGMDSGLLHLAACTETPILWVFTCVNPSLRVVQREKGKQLIIVPEDKLDCRFCETNMRFLPLGFDSRRCIYKDYKCMNLNQNEIIEAIGELLDGEER